MAILYGTMWGVRNVQDQQANQSANGIRLSLIPRKRTLVSSANLAASFTIVLVKIYIMLAVFRFVYQVDFGERWQWLLLVAALGSLCAILLGTLIGNLIPKMNLVQKDGILISVTIAMSFFAGMMGSEQMKYWIDLHMPIVGQLNLVNLISESLYKLYFYTDLASFYTNLLWLTGFIFLLRLEMLGSKEGCAMTLYKTIWTLLKANKSNLLIGVMITVVATFFYAQNIDVENTSLQDAKIALISEEESPVVDGLRKYLNEKQTLVTLDGTSQKEIDDALYFNRVNIILHLPADFTNKWRLGKMPTIKIQSRPDAFSKTVVTQQVNTFYKHFLFQEEDKTIDAAMEQTQIALPVTGEVELSADIVSG